MGSEKPALATALAAEEEKLLACIHCGLCLPACPTYDVLRDELDSPRGRLHLMRAAAEGRIALETVVERHLSRCLGCRACETVCPSGVHYGHLYEIARAEGVAQHGAASALGRAALGAAFGGPHRMDAAFGALRLARDAGVFRLLAGRARRAGAERAAGATGAGAAAHARADAAGAPTAASAGEIAHRPPAAPRFAAVLVEATRGRLEPSRVRIAEDPHGPPAVLLDGCVMPRLFSPVHRASANLLRRAGLRLVAAPASGCCGALHAHAGFLEGARAMARRNTDAMEGARFIVTESAGCGAMMRGYGDLLAGDPRYAEKARAFSERVRDLSEMLAEAAFHPGPSAFRARVAYDAPCHLHHAQRVTRAPIDLLEAVPGITLVPLAGSDRCCGGAGVYNLRERALSWSILREKLAAIRESGVEVVATGNPGCLMQIGAGMRLAGIPARALHPAEILEATWMV